MNYIPNLSASEIAITSAIIAAILEPLKKYFPYIVDNSLIPLLSMIVGVILVFTFLGDPGMTSKECLFSGVVIGWASSGGRDATKAASNGVSKIVKSIKGEKNI